MNIFLAGIIQGSLVEATIHQQDWRDAIGDVLKRHLPDANVYCHFSKHPQSITYDFPEIQKTFDEGLHEARTCDVLIAWLPSASMGTAIEMYEAFRTGVAVLTISPMTANWVVKLYSHKIFSDLEAFEAYLASGELEPFVRNIRDTAGETENRGNE
ncbi:MAG: hypothetical protein JXA11_00955 [Phycisphaerae bacterium]|nr:hypothetical protein [Phycisphaerae bacterium]